MTYPTIEQIGFEEAPVALIIVDEGGLVRAMNGHAETLLVKARSHFIGKMFAEKVAGKQPLLDLYQKAHSEKRSLQSEGVSLSEDNKDASRFNVRIAILPDDGGICIAMHEVMPDQNDTPSIFQGAQLARTLSHEINNPLTGIRGAAQLLKRKARDDQTDLLTLIEQETERVERLTARFSALERVDKISLLPVNIHEILDEALKLVKLGYQSTLEIVEDYDPTLPPILADRDQLFQAISNIIKNACEAMNGIDQAQLKIITRYDGVARLAHNSHRAQMSGAVAVSVIDNGEGISKALQTHIFEPFMTNKRGGMGIGLAIAKKVVSDHHGLIQLTSEPGHTHFRMLLPMAEADMKTQ